MSRADDGFLKDAKQKWQLAFDATEHQRKRITQALRAYGGDQWDPDALKARAAQGASLEIPFPVPARPSLVINLLREPVRQVLNMERASELGIEIVPADDFAGLIGNLDDTEIELREGLVRRIQRESEAADARTWAFTRAAIAGEGYYGVITRYLPGKTWDQEIAVQRFFNQSAVMLDPAHEQPDGSDALWGFVTNDYIPWEEYRRRWPTNARNERNTAVLSDAFQSLVEGDPKWFRQDGDQKYVRIADFWYVETTTRTLLQLQDGRVVWEDELEEDVPIQDRRRVDDRQIQWCQLDGVQVLEETDWPGPDLPLIKVVGEELQPYDQERRVDGMVQPALDSQQAFNSMVSKWVETIGLSPIPPFQATFDQIQGYEAYYQQANIRALPYLPYNLVSDGGKPLGPPTRTPIDTPIQAIAASVQLFREAVQSTTGIHDPQLGKVDPSLRSGRAIKALQQQSAHGTSNYLDNLKRSIRYEGQIINNLLYPIYGRQGRIARIMDAEGQSRTIAVNGPPQMSQQQLAALPQQAIVPPKVYQLSESVNANVIVKVTQSYDSRRDEERAILADLIGSNPIFMTWFGDLFFENSDGPGHQQMAERAKLMLDPKIQQMLAAKEQQAPIPPQVQAQMLQMQQQLQQAHQLLQQAQQEIQGKQADNQTKLQIAQLSADKDVRLRQMADATAIAVAKINALTKGIISDNEQQVEQLALAAEQDRTAAEWVHEAHSQARDHVHEHVQNQLDRQHEAAQTAQQQAHESVTQQIGQQADQQEAEAARTHELLMQPEAESEGEGQPT